MTLVSCSTSCGRNLPTFIKNAAYLQLYVIKQERGVGSHLWDGPFCVHTRSVISYGRDSWTEFSERAGGDRQGVVKIREVVFPAVSRL
jgi:hypothetical protein